MSVRVVFWLCEEILLPGEVYEWEKLHILCLESSLFRREIVVTSIFDNRPGEINFSQRGTGLTASIEQNDILIAADFPDTGEYAFIAFDVVIMIVLLHVIVNEVFIVGFLIVDDRHDLTSHHNVWVED